VKWLRWAFLLSALTMTACLDDPSSGKVPSAQEFGPGQVAEFCSMSLQEHSGPKAQIFVKGRALPYWFASVHDMFAFTLLPEEPRAIVAIYVNDMGHVHDWDHPEPGTWVEARKAFFVIDSRRHSGMDEAETVPFSDPAAAQVFIGQNGGRMVRFNEMPKDYILPNADSSPVDGDTAPRKS
jgi:copper chaperone NosL